MTETLTGKAILANKTNTVRPHSDHDSRLERRWRRRLSAFKKEFDRSPSNHLRREIGEKSSDKDLAEEPYNRDDEQDHGVVVDPDYKLFFENLREDGKSYVLEIEGNVVRYEQAIPCDEIKDSKVRENVKTATDLGPSEPEYVSASDLVDRDYLVYLSNLNEDGELADDEDGGDVDVKNLLRIKGLAKSGGKSTPSRRSMGRDKMWCPAKAQFREKVMDILRRPYDEKEYGELLQEISERKLVQGYKELRGRTKSYSLDSFGKSYLDHYKDLAKKIDMVRCDRPKVLNLIRGFFFWLKNLSHEGAFYPWLDSICLEVVPQSE